ncbi:TetR/AcrR family transcriptional regulator [Kineosporia mesophila]|uniref:TetR/AcrR family transcriptional regulator n=1 Tax=Kineosporia mesophila TaxID=566012 RepID=A0ABP7AL15_9ACTN|nr:TetR family transcriptional regulator [Kineosporia mesophila]MCD5354007.1 TetR/AcrR family transcriptional regulator [Kineosporia mesophila]
MTAPPSPRRPGATTQGLRELKKLRMRRLISDTATRMFLERGFDEVRVADIARACEVSEKTVHNYFPSKEALVLDEEEGLAEAVRAAASDPDRSPVEAMLVVLLDRTRELADSKNAHEGMTAMAAARQFFDLVEQTPSLRAHHRDSVDRLVTVAADGLARRTGEPVTSPEIQVTAYALISLWRVQTQSLHHHARNAQTPQQVAQRVRTDVQRAAQLVDIGLAPFWQNHLQLGDDQPAPDAPDTADHPAR